MLKVQGKNMPWREGMTLSSLLEELGDPYPYAVVKLDGRIVCQPDFDTTPVPDGSQIFLIPMVAGG
jgi:thiamine biosynthesis protein ThiS